MARRQACLLNRVNVGVVLVGLGRMGRVHLHAMREHVPALTLAAVAEPRLDVAAAGLIGEVAVYAEAGSALRHPGLAACVVAAPTEVHRGVVEEALELGLHVFCEKPLTLAQDESLLLQSSAASRGLVLQVGFWRRFAAPLMEARRLLRAGAIGRPVLVRLVQWDVDSPPATWCDPVRSGGIFVDMGVHEYDEIEWLLDAPITEVSAQPLALVNQELARVGDVDNALVFAAVEGGVRAIVELSRNGRYADDVRLEILGSDGALLVETVPTARVRLGTRQGLVTVWEGVDDFFLAAVGAELSAFAALASGDTTATNVPGAADSVRAVAIGEAARASAASGAPVAVA